MFHDLRSSARLHDLCLSGLLLLAPAAVACGGNKSVDDSSAGASSTSAGSKGVSPIGVAGAGATSGAASASSGAGGTPVTGTAGGLGAGSGTGGTGAAGQSGTPQATHDHCVYGYDPEPTMRR
ncbi:MAG: hypothetical protein WDO74_02115 [Pseudomonadota bacterium]